MEGRFSKQPNLHVFIASIAQTKLLSNMQVDQISNLTIFSYDGSYSRITRIVVLDDYTLYKGNEMLFDLCWVLLAN